jgi:uncharacterized protein
MMKAGKVVIGIAVVALLGGLGTGGLLASQSGRAEAKSDVQEDVNRVPIVVTPAKQMTFETRGVVSGNVQAKNFALVSARMPGPLDTVFVDEGDVVEAGKTQLFQTDSIKLSKAVSLARQGQTVALKSLSVTHTDTGVKMLFWVLFASLLVVLLLPVLVLVGTWAFHLRSATEVCDRISTLGLGGAGHCSLNTLGSCRECEVPTPDGLTLRGTYVYRRTPQRRGVLVFCHEFGGDRHVACPYIEGALDEGFDVFAFDFRHHGDSDRMEGYTPRTWTTRYEVIDVLAAIDYLCSDDDAPPEGVALMGLSRGANAAISAAIDNDDVWALITDGAFVSQWVVTANIRRFMPRFVRLAPVLVRLPWFVQAFYGKVVHDIVARKTNNPCIHLGEEVRRLQQPLLMIHGGRDSTIPLELARRLWKRMRNHARLWVVPKGGHNRSIAFDPQRYQRFMRRFLARHTPRQYERPRRVVHSPVREPRRFSAFSFQTGTAARADTPATGVPHP